MPLAIVAGAQLGVEALVVSQPVEDLGRSLPASILAVNTLIAGTMGTSGRKGLEQ